MFGVSGDRVLPAGGSYSAPLRREAGGGRREAGGGRREAGSGKRRRRPASLLPFWCEIQSPIRPKPPTRRAHRL
jgi:hypothetical protein